MLRDGSETSSLSIVAEQLSNRAGKLLGDFNLLDVPIRPSVGCDTRHLRRLMNSEDDYLYGWVETSNLFGRFDAAQLRHTNVHDDKVGLQLFGLAYRLLSVCGLTAHGTESTLHNESLHTAPQKLVVIDDQDSGIHFG